MAKLYWRAIKNTLDNRVEDGTAAPRVGLGKVVGNIVKTTGTVLEQDQIPALRQAFYVQARHELTPNLGVGARYRLGNRASLSVDYGQNRTDFGRYMNGHTRYEHAAGTSDFTLRGRERGGTPTFWVVRFDIGTSDTDVPHSWNAFIDYKAFEHGSFFGGNGTEGLPDRYLDGIRSFTVGAGYVPAKDFLLEAFYTFGARGIGKRDTLYGSENFKLGDYTRVQATYKF